MKSRSYWKWSLGLALAVLPFAGGHSQEALVQPTNTALSPNQPAVPDTAAPTPAAADADPADPTAEDDVVDAPAQPMTTDKPLPPGVKPSAPVAEVLKLADSGVDESVMLAYVTNSTSTFDLGAEEIIYLNDIGVPSAVVTAMIQRDQELKALSANAAPAPASPAPTEPAPPATEPAPAPAPIETAPQPDYTTGDYPPAIDSTYAPFYDSLAPYGTWVDVAGYGPCWQPTTVIVNAGWQPYCDGGRWVYTDYGWYWLSGYSWGWAPFHYGRWFRHNHYGWCWAPGSTWGPSWVSWRYNGNYCGWAPLPPAAVYQPTIGLTFHGQHVNNSFAFGLGVRSYTFVPVSHFSDPHPGRHALPHPHATQIYHQTVPSVTIAGNSTRVVNRGIPVSRVEAATHTQIHRVGIREVNTPGAQSARGERLEANSRTLSVFRPQFPQSAGAQPASVGRPRTDVQQGGAAAVTTPAPASPRVTPAQSPRTFGGSSAAQPHSGGGSSKRPDRSAIQANAAPITTAGPAPTVARQTSGPAPRPAEPLILHGADRSRGSTVDSGASAPNRATLPNPPVVSGSSRSARPIMTAEADVPAPSQPRWSAPQTIESPVRSESALPYTAPTYQAPAATPRSAPAPAYAPPRAQSYSPPAPSPAARAQPAAIQPVRSAPSAPAASSTAGRSPFSSGRNGR